MRQFDLYRNPQPRTAAVAPYLLALSSHLLPNVNIVIVAPLLRDR
ncbi:MAG: CcdB protein, partial [Caulobacter sp.]|nr:CcdB protein [Caulobacter sp.]